MIEVLSLPERVLPWIADRSCAECGQYVGDSEECNSAVCQCSECGQPKQHNDYRAASDRRLGNTAECERCLKAQETHDLICEGYKLDRTGRWLP